MRFVSYFIVCTVALLFACGEDKEGAREHLDTDSDTDSHFTDDDTDASSSDVPLRVSELDVSMSSFTTLAACDGVLAAGNGSKGITLFELTGDGPTATTGARNAERFCLTPGGHIWSAEEYTLAFGSADEVTFEYTIENTPTGLHPFIETIECQPDESVVVGGRYTYSDYDGDAPPPTHALLLHISPTQVVVPYTELEEFSVYAVHLENDTLYAGGVSGSLAAFSEPDVAEFIPVEAPADVTEEGLFVLGLTGTLPNLYITLRAGVLHFDGTSFTPLPFTGLSYATQISLAITDDAVYALAKAGSAQGYPNDETAMRSLYRLNGTSFEPVETATSIAVEVAATQSSLYGIGSGRTLLSYSEADGWTEVWQQQVISSPQTIALNANGVIATGGLSGANLYQNGSWFGPLETQYEFNALLPLSNNRFMAGLSNFDMDKSAVGILNAAGYSPMDIGMNNAHIHLLLGSEESAIFACGLRLVNEGTETEPETQFYPLVLRYQNNTWSDITPTDLLTGTDGVYYGAMIGSKLFIRKEGFNQMLSFDGDVWSVIDIPTQSVTRITSVDDTRLLVVGDTTLLFDGSAFTTLPVLQETTDPFLISICDTQLLLAASPSDADPTRQSAISLYHMNAASEWEPFWSTAVSDTLRAVRTVASERNTLLFTSSEYRFWQVTCAD